MIYRHPLMQLTAVAALALALLGVGLLASRQARGQTTACLDPTAAFTIPYAAGTIQAVTYYVNLSVLTVQWHGARTAFSVYPSVPQQVAQGFFGLASADSYYASRVKSHYKQAVLYIETLCPINTAAGGYLLASGQ